MALPRNLDAAHCIERVASQARSTIARLRMGRCADVTTEETGPTTATMLLRLLDTAGRDKSVEQVVVTSSLDGSLVLDWRSGVTLARTSTKSAMRVATSAEAARTLTTAVETLLTSSAHRAV